MNSFCIRCGATNKKMIGRLCLDCFLELYGLVDLSKPIEVVICPKCYSIKISGKWVKVVGYEDFVETLTNVIKMHLRPSREEVAIESVEVSHPEPYQPQINVFLRARVMHHYVEKNLLIPLAWRKELCSSCFRRAAGTYRAVVQVRLVHESQDIDKLKEELFAMFPDDIIEIEELKNGFDIKVSSEHVARRIALLIKRRWKAVKIAESYGDQRRRRDGRKTGRLYLSVRILNYKKGDYIVINNRAYIVEEIDSRTVTLRDSSGHKKTIKISELVKGVKK